MAIWCRIREIKRAKRSINVQLNPVIWHFVNAQLNFPYISLYFFFPRTIFSLSSVIVRVSVVLKRTVGDGYWRFDNLSGSHLQSPSNIVSSVDGITSLSAESQSILLNALSKVLTSTIDWL